MMTWRNAARALSVILLCSVGAGTSLGDEGTDESRGKNERYDKSGDDDDDNQKGESRGKNERYDKSGDDDDNHRSRKGRRDRESRYRDATIPNGHLPPPGECRIWYPDKPPGHQPPPRSCSGLRHEVPPGAWLIERSDRESEFVDVSFYDERRPGIVLDIGVFDVGTGAFVRLR